MRIWKYPLEVTDRLALTMPPGAKFLTVQMQHGKPCLWALVDETKRDTATRRIAIYGTGNPMPDEPGTYIATFQMMGERQYFDAACERIARAQAQGKLLPPEPQPEAIQAEILLPNKN